MTNGTKVVFVSGKYQGWHGEIDGESDVPDRLRVRLTGGNLFEGELVWIHTDKEHVKEEP